ncbi:hypothetical protein M0R45_002337 [Rubus argutus]|uniref:Uncharacterized protein n=1 Tax=Rubus argutus TaxID=59490 RepID=A0AAW1VBY5_RUBAR
MGAAEKSGGGWVVLGWKFRVRGDAAQRRPWASGQQQPVGHSLAMSATERERSGDLGEHGLGTNCAATRTGQ